MASPTGPLIVHGGKLYLQSALTPGSGTTVANISCDAVALEITPNIEDVDIGTLCNPVATETGRVTYSALAALLWSPELYALLAPHVGEQLYARFMPFNYTQLVPPGVLGDGELYYVSFQTRYAALPWGRFELGQRVEVDLPLAVLSTPTWTEP